MILYIWLIISNAIISCLGSVCNAQTNDHLAYLIQIGAVELVFELAGVIKIFVKRTPKDPHG